MNVIELHRVESSSHPKNESESQNSPNDLSGNRGGQTTTMSQDLSSDRGKLGRNIWIGILILATAGFLYHCYFIIIRFSEYQLYTKQEADYAGSKFDFPSVTFCPYSFLSWEKAQSAIVAGTNVRLVEDVMQTNLRNFWSIVLYNQMSSSIDSFDKTEAKVIEYAALTSLLPYAGKMGVFNQPEDAIVYCSYRKKPCNYRNFTPVVFRSRVCFRFDPREKDDHQIGPEKGLTILLYRLTLKHTTKNTLNPRLVDKFYVHPAGTWPVDNSPGEMLVQSWLNYQLSQSEIWREATPVRGCIDSTYVTRCHPGRNGEITCLKYRYNDVICDNDYRQRELVARCNCVSSDWLLTEDLVGIDNCFKLPNLAFENRGFSKGGEPGKFYVTLLSTPGNHDINIIGNVTQFRSRVKCFWEYRNAPSRSGKCPEPNCKEKWYTNKFYRVSREYSFYSDKSIAHITDQMNTALANINSDRYDNTTVAFHVAMSQRIPRYFNYIAQTFSSLVDIHIASLETSLAKENLIYTLPTFLSDIGGVIGLWIGLSVVTVFEIGEYTGRSVLQKMKKTTA